MAVASRLSVEVGPPLHDCLFVGRRCDVKEVSKAMSAAIADVVGVSVEVRAKEIEVTTALKGFHLTFDKARFQEADFVPNLHLATQEDIDESIAQYNTWLRRFFVSITDEINPMVAQIFYSPDSDRVKRVVCRTPQ